jgi:hypothetical protein
VRQGAVSCARAERSWTRWCSWQASSRRQPDHPKHDLTAALSSKTFRVQTLLDGVQPDFLTVQQPWRAAAASLAVGSRPHARNLGGDLPRWPCSINPHSVQLSCARLWNGPPRPIPLRPSVAASRAIVFQWTHKRVGLVERQQFPLASPAFTFSKSQGKTLKPRGGPAQPACARPALRRAQPCR